MTVPVHGAKLSKTEAIALDINTQLVITLEKADGRNSKGNIRTLFEK